MTEYEKLEKLGKDVTKLFKDAGFDQFVVMGHNCQKDQVWIGRSSQMCNFTRTVNTVVESINASAGGMNLMNNQSQN
ncbi:hypothetical protein ACAW74_25825 [Fibrella sp. WM1]|uniref:hypothetical protein n=1 Tax=Fibrella musci TaxID=3242485 RepID=UPI003521BA59